MSADDAHTRGRAGRPGSPAPDELRGPGTPRPPAAAWPAGTAQQGRGHPHAHDVSAAERRPARSPRGSYYDRKPRFDAVPGVRPGRTARLRAPEATRSNALHAGAWWLWALGLAVAASRTTNPLLLLMLVAVAGYVVAARRTDSPWARSYGAFLKLGLLVLAIRLVFAFVLGTGVPGTHVLVHLPEVPLPDWAQGLRIGGRVMAEEMLFALYEGLRLATLLVCLGAANALANPARLLKSLPGALYEVGVAVVVAMTFAPNLVADVLRLRAARRLRGRDDKGVRALLQIGLPVLEDALQRSVALAATMDTRGYGRTARVPAAVRHTTTALTLGGLLGLCAGSYALLSATGAAYGTPLLAGGLAAALGGLWLGGRRSVRSHYRPDAWGVRAWLVAGSGAAVAALTVLAASELPTAALQPPVVPPTAPTLPLWPAAALLIGLLPAFVAPAPATPARSSAGSDKRPATPADEPPGPGRMREEPDGGCPEASSTEARAPGRRPGRPDERGATPAAGARDSGRSPGDPGRGGAGENIPPRRRATDAARPGGASGRQSRRPSAGDRPERPDSGASQAPTGSRRRDGAAPGRPGGPGTAGPNTREESPQ